MSRFLVSIVCVFAAGVCAAVALADKPVTTAISDNFNRADENPIAGSWASPVWSGATACKVVSNRAAATSASSNCYYTTSLPADQEAFATVAVLPGSGNAVGLHIRVTNPGTTSERGFICQYGPSIGFQIRRDANGASGVIGSDATITMNAGDGFMCAASGSAITFSKYDAATASWSRQVTARDTTAGYQGSGYAGMQFSDTVGRLDDFSNHSSDGQVVSVSTATVTVNYTDTVYTSAATVTVGGTGTTAMGGNCGGVTTNELDEEVPQAPCTVLLDGDSASRMDLSWWGIWAAVGLLLCALVAPFWRDAFRWWR